MTVTPDAPVVLYDTTLRDGTQGENITLSLADKLRIARMLDEFGMPFVEGGWPGSNPKDIEFFAAARTMRWEGAKLAAFGMTRHRSNNLLALTRPYFGTASTRSRTLAVATHGGGSERTVEMVTSPLRRASLSRARSERMSFARRRASIRCC